MRYVYADNSATTALSPKVLEKMMPYLTEVYGNPSSIYTIGAKARAAVETARENIAKNLGAANPNEIYFTSGGSESDNWALKGVCHALKAKGKKHIISTAFEHHAVLHTLKRLETVAGEKWSFPPPLGIKFKEGREYLCHEDRHAWLYPLT